MRKVVAALAFAGALIASPAHAADKSGPAIIPDLTPVSTATSCYVQGLAGGAITSSTPDGAVLPVSLSAQSWSVAAGLGCDLRFDRVVVGAFGRLEFPVDTSGSLIEADKSWQVGARVGYLKHGYMPYLMAGYESSEFSFANLDLRRDGWFVGGGLELMLTSHLSLVGEYQYSGLGSTAALGMPMDVDAHKLRFGVNFRFNSLFGD